MKQLSTYCRQHGFAVHFENSAIGWQAQAYRVVAAGTINELLAKFPQNEFPELLAQKILKYLEEVVWSETLS